MYLIYQSVSKNDLNSSIISAEHSVAQNPEPQTFFPDPKRLSLKITLLIF